MTEEEVENMFQGHEDAQGNVNYEGTFFYISLCILTLTVKLITVKFVFAVEIDIWLPVQSLLHS